jgi:hypothetical protein
LKASRSFVSVGRNAKAPPSIRGLPSTSGANGVVDSAFRGLLHDRAGGERRTGEDVDTPRLDGVQPGDLVRDDQDVALLVPGVDGVLDLRVPGAGGELRLLRHDVLVVVQPLRVALADDERVEHLVVGVGEDDLLAAFRVHVHPGGHDVELLRVQTGDERAELGGHGLHLSTPSRLKMLPRNFGASPVSCRPCRCSRTGSHPRSRAVRRPAPSAGRGDHRRSWSDAVATRLQPAAPSAPPPPPRRAVPGGCDPACDRMCVCRSQLVEPWARSYPTADLFGLCTLTRGRHDMIDFIEVSLAKRNVHCRAKLLDDRAPITCAAVWNALPLSGDVYHAKYARNEIYALFPPFAETEPPLENPTVTPIPGDLCYFAFAGTELGTKAYGYDREVRPARR